MKVFFTALTLGLLFSVSYSQSVYSYQGLGELQHQGMPNNFATGEVGIGMPTLWHVNTMNPANLVYNQLSSFQLGLELDRRNFRSENGTLGNNIDGGLRYMAYAFPIKPGIWSSAFGILPFSKVGYNTFGEGRVEGVEDIEVMETRDNRGEGGLTSLFWSNGVAINKNWYVGIRSNFTFGLIKREQKNTISGTDLIANNTTFTDSESYADISFQFGLAYNKSIGENKYFRGGLTFVPKSNLNGTAKIELSGLSGANANLEALPLLSMDLNAKIPAGYGIGFSYSKVNHITVGLDAMYQRWSQVSSTRTIYENFTKVAVGIEWIPDHDNVKSYFKRAKYQFGFNAQKLPYVVRGQSLLDFGVNFGTSLPVSGSSSLDLAFKIGRLGTTKEGLVREIYYKVVFGATINDRWFIKRRYD